MGLVERTPASFYDSGPFSEALADVNIPATTSPVKAPKSSQPLPLRGVRWYWHKPAFSAKGQVVSADVPHRAQIQRFCDADSEALEAKFRERKDEIESAWWQEHSELAEGPKAVPKSTSLKDEKHNTPKHAAAASSSAAAASGSMSRTVVDAAARRRELLDKETSATSWEEFKANARLDAVGVLVRGRRWEVDLLLRLMSPCYWPEAQHRVMRGTWFMEKGPDWVPLAETVADELETAFRREVWRPELRHLAEQKQGIIAARIDLATSSVKGTYALFVSEDEVYLCLDDTYSWVSRKMGSAAKGAALRRGYTQPYAGSLEVDVKTEEADNAAAVAPVDRLILAVHGIGQKLSRASIVDDATSLRNLVLSAASDPEFHARAGGGGGRIELLPVQWRKGLNLGVDALAERLMPASLEALRGILHATAVEVLLYLTPLHCQDMLDSVILSLNATYAKFISRNPCFKGKISIVAHSLGSVLTWDILSCQPRWYAALPAHRSLIGAADTSLAALERLSASGGPTQPLDNSTETQLDDSVSQSVAAESTSGDRSTATPSHEQHVLQPLRSEDLRLTGNSFDGNALSGSGNLNAKMPSSHVKMQSSHVKMQSSHSRSPKQRSSDPADVKEAAALSNTAAVDSDEDAGQSAAVADATAAAEQPSEETQRLKQEVKRLRTQLRAATAKCKQANLPDGEAGGPGMSREEAAQLQPAVTVSQLDFPVDQFLCIGSPNGLFLALRKVDPGQQRGLGTPAAAKLMPGGGGGCDGLPAVNRAYNLFHPYDPVAYRMEPLAVVGGERRRPVFADYHRGGRRIHIGLQEMSEDVGSAVSGFGAAAGRVTGSLWGGLRGSLGRAVAQSRAADAAAAKLQQGGASAPPSDAPSQQAADAEVLARTFNPGTAFWRLTRGRGTGDARAATGRLDFVLQESPTENQYLSAISSHFSYWNSPDTALLLARAVSGLDVLTGRPVAEGDSGNAESAARGGNTPGKDRARSAGSSPKATLIGNPTTPLSPQELVDRAWHHSAV